MTHRHPSRSALPLWTQDETPWRDGVEAWAREIATDGMTGATRDYQVREVLMAKEGKAELPSLSKAETPEEREERLQRLVSPIAEAQAWERRIAEGHGHLEDYDTHTITRLARSLLWAWREALTTPGLTMQQLRRVAGDAGLKVAPWGTSHRKGGE